MCVKIKDFLNVDDGDAAVFTRAHFKNLHSFRHPLLLTNQSTLYSQTLHDKKFEANQTTFKVFDFRFSIQS